MMMHMVSKSMTLITKKKAVMSYTPSASRSSEARKSESDDSVKLRNIYERPYTGRSRFCRCMNANGTRVKASLWTSWTDKNPGRRFHGCRYYEKDGCGFFEWHDEPLTDRAMHVINELKWGNRRLQSAMFELECDSLAQKLESEVEEVNSRKDAVHLELERKTKMKKNCVIVVLFCVLVVVVCVFVC
ncbi:unnamed protein product [Cuscuta epithymum]|uniref:GRF-type domain-containing protein n=1 Tax=Cuscuta epithymum TaxID=186058 RepID=A0AAV0E9L0_9ASTE|nr:unnamed protein product [Cuscuta epithymum]